jgi:hypothetical protein
MLGSEILESFVVDVNESDKIITVWNNLQAYRGKFPMMKQVNDGPRNTVNWSASLLHKSILYSSRQQA